MFIVKDVVATPRRLSGNLLAVRQNPRCLLVNDGKHVHISFPHPEGGPIEWKWLKYNDFKTLSNLSDTCVNAPSLFRLRTYGHSGRMCSVLLKQSLEVVRKNGGTEPRYDWQMKVYLFPNKPLLIHEEGHSVYGSVVLFPNLKATYQHQDVK